jgi:hypothetical protein
MYSSLQQLQEKNKSTQQRECEGREDVKRTARLSEDQREVFFVGPLQRLYVTVYHVLFPFFWIREIRGEAEREVFTNLSCLFYRISTSSYTTRSCSLLRKGSRERRIRSHNNLSIDLLLPWLTQNTCRVLGGTFRLVKRKNSALREEKFEPQTNLNFLKKLEENSCVSLWMYQ